MTAIVHRPALSSGDASDELVASLEPVRAALLSEARGEARRLLDDAGSAAEQRVAEAEAEVERAVERARRRADATARARAERAIDDARRDAHAVVLEAERAIYLDLLDRLHRAVTAMPSDPRYPALLDRLSSAAARQLGGGAQITRDPPDGGVMATLGPRRVDDRLPALADRILTSIAEEVSELWA